MNYILQLNGFWDWRRFNKISHGEVDLYFAILHMANTSKWKTSFNIPNTTLLGLTRFYDSSALSKARNKLVQSGLIEYRKSHDGAAGTYKLKCLYSSESDTDLDSGLDTEMDTGLDSGLDTIHKQKIKQNKNKKETPIIPFEDELREKFDEWLAYKSERGQKYKPTGLKSLIKKIEDGVRDHGEAFVISAIDNSISNNWQGLFFDRAGKQEAVPVKSSNPFLDMLKGDEVL